MAGLHGHAWQFVRTGGMGPVVFRGSDDIVRLGEWVPKLWAALVCPTQGLEFDTRTLALIDTHKDGRIRLPELIAACEWACRVRRDPDVLVTGGDTLAISDSHESDFHEGGGPAARMFAPLSTGAHTMRITSLPAPARVALHGAVIGAAAFLLASCAAPFQPSLGPGAPMPGTHGSAPVVANMNCAKAGESFFQRPWQSTAFGGSRYRPDGNYEVILNNADGRRAMCVVNAYGVVFELVPF